MFRWTIAGEVFWSMSFDWGLASETRENGGFASRLASETRENGGSYARKAAALTGGGFYFKINTTYVIFGLCAVWMAAFSRCIWAMSSRASSSVISWVSFWSHGRGKYWLKEVSLAPMLLAIVRPKRRVISQCSRVRRR